MFSMRRPRVESETGVYHDNQTGIDYGPILTEGSQVATPLPGGRPLGEAVADVDRPVDELAVPRGLADHSL